MRSIILTIFIFCATAKASLFELSKGEKNLKPIEYSIIKIEKFDTEIKLTLNDPLKFKAHLIFVHKNKLGKIQKYYTISIVRNIVIIRNIPNSNIDELHLYLKNSKENSQEK